MQAPVQNFIWLSIAADAAAATSTTTNYSECAVLPILVAHPSLLFSLHVNAFAICIYHFVSVSFIHSFIYSAEQNYH